MTDEEIQEMHDRFGKKQRKRNEALRARRRQEAAEANARFDALSPADQFLVRCGATLDSLNVKSPAIDPEADLDRPLQDEWKDVERYQL